MATQPRTRFQTSRSSRPKKDLAEKADQDFLASVMVSVSDSLESMSEDDRERAVVAAERAVAHIQ